MTLAKRYHPQIIERDLQIQWDRNDIYKFDQNSDTQVFSIDTPPATVSGKLHLGHIFSYSHPDFIARFYRMNGYNVFYPMGFDDNGLPTGRYVEHRIGKRAEELGREEFNTQCLAISKEAENEYKELWQRLGLSIDWTYTYRTIDDDSRKIAQQSFQDLFSRGFAYRKDSPTIWCPECRTAIAQAELEDYQQKTNFITLNFKLVQTSDGTGDNKTVQIATTRPELLASCVAVFVHPKDERYLHLNGKQVEVPIFGHEVPILRDPLVDMEKGTGVVMCCTFGDQIDVMWWKLHDLPLIESIDSNGLLTQSTREFMGLSITEAQEAITQKLTESGYVVSSESTIHSVRVHERCGIPVEYIISPQWFIRILDAKESLIETGNQVNWVPDHMKSRYRSWVENLNWDWCISRQRFFGVPFPLWYCRECEEVIMADPDQLPVNPEVDTPIRPCHNCGSTSFIPEKDVLDTWATSSLTPQIVGKWQTNPKLYDRVFPFSMRSQAHEIIRTWAFYTITKSHYHFNSIPWKNALISGWGIAGEGMGKISKSRGDSKLEPLDIINLYSADAVRYWAASTGPGKDAIISEEKIQIGSKLVTKLWNVARFSCPFISEFLANPTKEIPDLSAADVWVLSKLQGLIHRVTELFKMYDYASAKAETETFFWEFSDNYLEMVKQRLYDRQGYQREGALFSLKESLLTLIKLFAPIFPHVTEEIYQGVYIQSYNQKIESTFESIHLTKWPEPNTELISFESEKIGHLILDITTFVRRYKSENNVSLNTPIKKIGLFTKDQKGFEILNNAIADLKSVTRADEITVKLAGDEHNIGIPVNDQVSLIISP